MNTSLFDNKIIHKFCYEVNGYIISVSSINATIHMYLTVRLGTSLLGDVHGGLSQSSSILRSAPYCSRELTSAAISLPLRDEMKSIIYDNCFSFRDGFEFKSGEVQKRLTTPRMSERIWLLSSPSMPSNRIFIIIIIGCIKYCKYMQFKMDRVQAMKLIRRKKSPICAIN